MMESVVLDNDYNSVDNSGDGSGNPFDTESSSQTNRVDSNTNNNTNNNNNINNNQEQHATASPTVIYTESYSSSPSSSSTFTNNMNNMNISNNSNNNNKFIANDTAAFAPEYNRESTSFNSDSAFRETQFSAEIAPAPKVETIPIDIVVTEPEKLGDGMNSYITYKIKTTATYPKFKEYSVVVRRYNDFVWFHDQLRNYNKGVLIPPLPEKALINRFSAEFIEVRRKELEKFLNRVAQHPILHKRQELVFFLESADDQFTSLKSKTAKPQPAPEQQQQQQSNTGGGGGGGFGSFVSFLGHGIAAATNFTASSTAREIDHWFDGKKNYVTALEAHLTTLLKSTSKLLAKRKELASAAISLVGSTEAESDSFLSTAFIRIDLGEQLYRNESTHFEEALKDYIRVLGAVKDMFADRDEILLDYQNATRLLDTKKEKLEKDKIKSSSSSKVRASEKDVEDAQKKVEDTKRDYDNISTIVRNEFKEFEITRAREIRRMIALLVQSNMENSLQVVDLWKSYISDTQGSDEKDWKTFDKVGWGGAGLLR